MCSAIPPSRDPTDIFQRECEALNTKLDQQKLRIEQIEPAFERIKACYEAAVRALRASPSEELTLRAGSPEGLSEELGAIYRATCEKLLKENPKLHLEITTPLLKSESPLLRTPSPDLHHDITRVVMIDWKVTTLLNSGTALNPELGTYGLEQSLNCLSRLHNHLETEIRYLNDSPELRPLLENLFLKQTLLQGKIAEVRRNLCDLSIRDDKFLPKPEEHNPFYNAIIEDRIAFHTRTLGTLSALDPLSPQIPQLESHISKLQSLIPPQEKPIENTQAIFCKMHNLNIKCGSLWRHLGFLKHFLLLSFFEKEHFSQALPRDIQAIKNTIREIEGISLNPSIKSVFNTELEALKATLEVLIGRLEVVDAILLGSAAENDSQIRSFLLSGKGSATLSEDLRASIISELGFL
ncbi:MAG: hypothetical protein NTX49_09335 [Chlamydiae bacterium]|nr:hypothetical protein [Chlamydiota bacterium]